MVAMAVFRSDTHDYEVHISISHVISVVNRMSCVCMRICMCVQVAQLGFSFWLLVVGWALVMAAAVIPLWSPDYYVTIE